MNATPLAGALPRAVLVLWLVSTPALAAGPVAHVLPTVEQLPDGSELVLASRPQAAWASLHYVVRTGGWKDPYGKEGLAHVLEHVIFHGSHDVPGQTFQTAVRAAGGNFNGYTSANATVFTLQVPSESFPPLAEQFLRIITDPLLDPEHLRREVDIIRTEDLYFGRGPGFHEHLEDSLFTGIGSRSVIGTQQSRLSITRDDLMRFYAEHYLPANTSLVFTGGVQREQVLAMIDRSVRLPPSLPGENVPAKVEAPVLPIEKSTRALISFVAYGYRVEPEDRAKCSRVAALLQLRLTKELHIEEPMVTGMEVKCMSLRGNTFLLALAYSASLDASTLPDRLQHAFSRVAKQPATPEEEKLMDRHLKQERAQEEEDDLKRGTELAREVAQPRSGPLDPALLLNPSTRLPRGAMQDFARRTFTPERQVMVNFSPFAG
ncbi:M16 family metallopeptidase [Archangium lipolyticum]|uniref:M16 family metallopeptidase n=1 Tax=Archangium lipolyticum TaxID=2970465 RepID=UPI00214A5012|nr:insulinase family protein [Archangium lipolyticum]